MSRKTHNRFLMAVCLFLTLAAFALTFAQISQGSSMTDGALGCSPDATAWVSFLGTCPGSPASFESASLMLFGLGLVGFAHAIRRSFGNAG